MPTVSGCFNNSATAGRQASLPRAANCTQAKRRASKVASGASNWIKAASTAGRWLESATASRTACFDLSQRFDGSLPDSYCMAAVTAWLRSAATAGIDSRATNSKRTNVRTPNVGPSDSNQMLWGLRGLGFRISDFISDLLSMS
jgi:hypothetical protein